MGETEGIFFDFHGVLADDGGARKDARLKAFRVLAERRADERFLNVPSHIHEQAHLRARGTEGIVGYVLRRTGIVPSDAGPDHHTVKEAAELQRNFYRQAAADGVDAMPGALDLVHHARDRFGPDNVAIVTGGRSWEVAAYLGRHGLQVDVVITKDDTPGQTKPNPWPYQRALKETGLSASSVAIVEDSAPGLQAAMQAGIERRVGVSARHDPDILLQAGATVVVGSLVEVRAHLAPMAEVLP